MKRLCDELNSEKFGDAHPILQASYAHYALTAVHPFADGNGRVARALASIYTYRSISVPLLITDDTKQTYFDVLAAADNGIHQPFVDFILDRAISSIKLVESSMIAAEQPTVQESSDQINQLYFTKGGFEHGQVDQAGANFFALFDREAQEQLAQITSQNPKVIISRSYLTGAFPPPSKYGYRHLVRDDARGLYLTAETQKPASAKLERRYFVVVPVDCARDDELMIISPDSVQSIGAEMWELYPKLDISLEMRLRIGVRDLLQEMMQALAREASEVMVRSGFGKRQT